MRMRTRLTGQLTPALQGGAWRTDDCPGQKIATDHSPVEGVKHHERGGGGDKPVARIEAVQHSATTTKIGMWSTAKMLPSRCGKLRWANHGPTSYQVEIQSSIKRSRYLWCSGGVAETLAVVEEGSGKLGNENTSVSAWNEVLWGPHLHH